MSDRVPSDCLLYSWMLRNIHEQKRVLVKKECIPTKLTGGIKNIWTFFVIGMFPCCNVYFERMVSVRVPFRGNK